MIKGVVHAIFAQHDLCVVKTLFEKKRSISLIMKRNYLLCHYELRASGRQRLTFEIKRSNYTRPKSLNSQCHCVFVARESFFLNGDFQCSPHDG